MGVLASDTFARANENPLGNGVWTTCPSRVAMQIVSSVATPTDLTTTDNGSYYSGIAWPADQFSRARMTVNGTVGAGSGIALYVRQAAGADTQYWLACDHAATNNIQLFKHVAGVLTAIAGWPRTLAWTDDSLWELQAIGTSLRVFCNGVAVGLPATDTSIATGSPGIGFSTAETSASLRAWEGGTPDVSAPMLGSLFVGPSPIGGMLHIRIANARTPVTTASAAVAALFRRFFDDGGRGGNRGSGPH